jgi:hypothetical protein
VTRSEKEMDLFFRIATIEDLAEIQDYEIKKISEMITDPMEREIQSWNSRWRKESLEHFLPNGWCFLARDPLVKSELSNEGQLVAYYLAQPILFFEGQTQSLWIEHMAFTSLQARDEICSLAVKLSREKHFQRVYFPNTLVIQNSISHLKPHPFGPSTLFVKTTKVS